MSGLLFLIIPRFELASGFFLDRYITRKSRSGFTDTVKFGDVTELIKDDSVAMRVDITNTGNLPGDPYWRLVVMDEYLPDGFRVSAQLKGHLLVSQRTAQVVRGRANPVRRPLVLSHSAPHPPGLGLHNPTRPPVARNRAGGQGQPPTMNPRG